MSILDNFLHNILHPPVLFFLLGILAAVVKSDLDVPPQIAKFLSLYLLFDIGIKGGEELFHSGFNPSMLQILFVCALLSFLIPFACYKILRFKLNIYDAGTIAAAYGSISAINFIANSAFLDDHQIPYNGFMVAAMALMESPAIISGLLLIGLALRKESKNSGGIQTSFKKLFHEAVLNGPVFLLIGSLSIGYIAGSAGEAELKPFVADIFKGMLCFYMLDMGLVAGQKLKDFHGNVLFLGSFAVLYPIIAGTLSILLARALGMEIGNAVLFTTLVSSASFIAVPAAMRMTVPQANMSLLLPMSLGITFVFNIIFGAPLYLYIIKYVWAFGA